MYYIFENRYKRWQYILPKSIRLEDFNKIGINVDFARDFMAEITQLDQLNKVIEFMEEKNKN